MKRPEIQSIQERFPARSQQGVALAVALILLIVVTLVGLAGVRGTSLQEKMAGNAFDRETAFQAAEAALAVGLERVVSDLSAIESRIAANAELDCSTRTCEDNPALEVDAGAWFPVVSGTGLYGFEARDSASTPQFVVQYMGEFESTSEQTTQLSGCASYGGCGVGPKSRKFRVTARSRASDETSVAQRSVVILQATLTL